MKPSRWSLINNQNVGTWERCRINISLSKEVVESRLAKLKGYFIHQYFWKLIFIISLKIKSHYYQSKINFRSDNALFEVIWHSDGSISFKANNGKYLGTKKSGHLYANCDDFSEERSKYYFYLINRPVLVLKCDQGFVGYKSSGSTRLECNKASYETIVVERGDKGMVNFRGKKLSIKSFCRFQKLNSKINPHSISITFSDQ